MPKSVAWREGLFLKPQHFQQMNFNLQREFILRSILTGATNWGLIDFEVNEHVLINGKFSLLHATGFLPDGTLFIKEDFVEPLTIDITKSDEGKGIFLGLPLLFENEQNTFFEEQQFQPTRYYAKTVENIPNLNSGEDSFADIAYMYPNFILIKEDMMSEYKGYSTIQIARIASVGTNNEVSLDSNFAPVYLHLDKAEKIVSKLKELQGIIKYRAEKITEKISGGSMHSTELGDYLVLQILNKSEIRLNYFITQQGIHPSELFLELTSIIGELTLFLTKEKRVKNQFTYVHADQNEIFNELYIELKKLLGKTLESKSLLIPLDKHKHGLYIGLLKDKSLLSGSTFILAVTGNIEENRLKKMILDNLKIGSIEEISNLVNYHLPGFKLLPLSTVPREIPFRVNNLYFKISIGASEREKLLKSTGLAVHFPVANKYSLEFSLWAIRK